MNRLDFVDAISAILFPFGTTKIAGNFEIFGVKRGVTFYGSRYKFNFASWAKTAQPCLPHFEARQGASKKLRRSICLIGKK